MLHGGTTAFFIPTRRAFPSLLACSLYLHGEMLPLTTAVDIAIPPRRPLECTCHPNKQKLIIHDTYDLYTNLPTSSAAAESAWTSILLFSSPHFAPLSSRAAASSEHQILSTCFSSVGSLLLNIPLSIYFETSSRPVFTPQRFFPSHLRRSHIFLGNKTRPICSSPPNRLAVVKSVQLRNTYSTANELW